METLSGTQEIIHETSTRGEIALNFIMSYGPKIIVAIILLIIGRWIIKYLQRLIDKALHKAKVDISLRKFLESLIGIILKITLVIALAGFLGFKSTSLIAILGAAGLAVGLALQGSLSNVASGIMILLFKPYKVGDFVDINGKKGTVTNINIFHTEMKSPDHRTIITPNAVITSDTVINHTTIGTLRVDVSVGISYSADIQEAKSILTQVITDNEYIIDEPAPGVFVNELGDNSVNLLIRVYCTPSNYLNTYFSLTEQVKIALDKADIEIPFPQRVIHMTK